MSYNAYSHCVKKKVSLFPFVPQGVTYDHVELNLYLNGKNMHCPASGIRGTVYPVVYGEFLCWSNPLANILRFFQLFAVERLLLLLLQFDSTRGLYKLIFKSHCMLA